MITPKSNRNHNLPKKKNMYHTHEQTMGGNKIQQVRFLIRNYRWSLWLSGK